MADKQTELAWAAGFYDGEGCTYLSHGSGGRKRYIRLSVSQNELQPLERFQAIAGSGNIVARSQGGYLWTLSGAKARDFIEGLWPYLSDPKRNQYLTKQKEVAAFNG